MLRLSYPRILDRMLFLAAAVSGAAILLASDWQTGWFVENGPVEIVQLAVLVLSAILFVRASRGLSGWGALTTLGLAVLSLLALARETPRCTSPLYEFGPCLSGTYKDAVYVAAALFPLVAILWNRELRLLGLRNATPRNLLRFIPRLLPLLLLLPLAAGSQLAEIFRLPVAEEVLETTTYLLLLLFALRAAQAADRLAWEARSSAISKAAA